MAQSHVPTLSGLVLSDDSIATANTVAVRNSAGDIFMTAARCAGPVYSGGAFFGTVSASKTANFTVDTTANLFRVDATAGAVTATLPAAATSTGMIVTVKRTSASNNVILDGSGSETIDGAATKTITTNYGFLTVQCDGTAWHIIATGGTIT